MRNYLRGKNAFSLVGPPRWWLREMAVFDPQLVLFPSSRRATYILARRATRSSGESPHDARGVSQNLDTLFMAERRLVRVCEILPGTLWDMRVFQKLAAHDIQRLGGGTQVARMLEAADDQRRAALDRQQDDELDQRSHAAYNDYQYRVGARLSLAKSHGRGTLRTTPVSVHVRTPVAPLRPSPILVAP